MGQRQYALVRKEDGNLELFRGPFFPNGSTSPGHFLTPDDDDPTNVPRGPWRVIKTYTWKESAELDALVALIGWDKVRTLFKYSKDRTQNW